MLVTIRIAKPKDWKIIQKLNNEVFQSDRHNDDDLDLTWPFSKIGIDYYKRLAKGEYGRCLIASVNNIDVGYAALAVKDFGYRKSKYIEIENIGVSPEYRSHGIGSRLMKEAEKWAKVENATKMYIAAYSNNTSAIRFYKKHGYKEFGIELDKELKPQDLS